MTRALNRNHSNDYRKYQIERLFEQAASYLSNQPYLAQLLNSHRASIMDAEATALARFQLVLHGIHEAGAFREEQFEHLASLILSGQAEGWLY
ncbi:MULTISPECIES: hypothetical protein [Pseudomonas]|jgi:hypothetical protein|uniref:hypothetical protein n=1 Tax=Pseudomonas TaxID=286 RepID=UPI000F7A6288|nr:MULTISPECIES: hypothetical protein [Pseudomonas]RRW43194.1 hypothetical protein EGJ50_19400 [Pseudomonas luteola]